MLFTGHLSQKLCMLESVFNFLLIVSLRVYILFIFSRGYQCYIMAQLPKFIVWIFQATYVIMNKRSAVFGDYEI